MVVCRFTGKIYYCHTPISVLCSCTKRLTLRVRQGSMIDHRHTGRLQGNSYQHRLSSSEPDQQRTAHHQCRVQASANHRWTCDRKPSHLFWASLINFTYKGRVYPGLMDHVRKKKMHRQKGPFVPHICPLMLPALLGKAHPRMEDGPRLFLSQCSLAE